MNETYTSEYNTLLCRVLWLWSWVSCSESMSFWTGFCNACRRNTKRELVLETSLEWQGRKTLCCPMPVWSTRSMLWQLWKTGTLAGVESTKKKEEMLVNVVAVMMDVVLVLLLFLVIEPILRVVKWNPSDFVLYQMLLPVVVDVIEERGMSSHKRAHPSVHHKRWHLLPVQATLHTVPGILLKITESWHEHYYRRTKYIVRVRVILCSHTHTHTHTHTHLQIYIYTI